MPALKNAILNLPREDRAAFMYAYQHAPHTVKQETPPSRFVGEFEGLLSPVGEPDAADAAGLAEAAMRLCNYWKYKWILFYSDEGGSTLGLDERLGEPSTRTRRVRGDSASAASIDGSSDEAAQELSGHSLFLQPTKLSHLTECARLALASGYLTILPDVTVLVSSTAHSGTNVIRSCPVVCFDASRLRHHYDATSYLQSAFYFWSVLCQERWQQRDEQVQHEQNLRDGQGTATSVGRERPPVLVEASSKYYVGLIIINPETVLNEDVQAWVDMTLTSVPMYAHSLHVLACTSIAAASQNTPYDFLNSSSSAHFYSVVLPRTIKVFGKLMREREVHIHVRANEREFAELLHETHGIPPSVLPAKVGGTLCEQSLWRSRLEHQASLEGTRDFLPTELPSSDSPLLDQPTFLATFSNLDAHATDPQSMYLDAKMGAHEDEDDIGKGIVVGRMPWDDDASHMGLLSQEANDVVDSLLYFHGSETAPVSPAPLRFNDAPDIRHPTVKESMAEPTTSAMTPQSRTISIEEAVQLVHAEDMVGRGDGMVVDLAALEDALHTAPSLVTSETPWEVFLSWAQYAHRPALALLSCWWRLRREWFGPKAWLKNMTQTGEGALSRKEISFLRSSECIQWLPVDAHGRSVLYLDFVEALSHTERENMDRMVVLRCAYYALHVVASDHGRRQRSDSVTSSRLAVVVVSPDRRPPVPFESFLETHYSVGGAMRQLWGSFPMVLDGIHLLPATMAATNAPPLNVNQHLSHPSNRIRVHELYGVFPMHRSCCSPSIVFRHDGPETLSQHGLSQPNLPTSVGGSFGRLQFSQWLELRVRHEWCVPAGTRNKALLDMFDFSHVKPLSDLRGIELAERKRRMNILHTRRKRDREHQEELQSRDQIEAFSMDNGRLRAETDRLEKLLESSRSEMSRLGLPDPSLMKPIPQAIECAPQLNDKPPPESEAVPKNEPSSDPVAAVAVSAATPDATVASNDEAMLAERTKSRNRLYSQRKRDKDRITLETLSQQVEVLTAQNRALRSDHRDLEDRLQAALWEVSQRDPFF